MEPTPAQNAAAARVFKAMSRLELYKFLGNLISTISTFAAFIAPFLISFNTENWINLLLILLYPCVLFSMSWLRHSKLADSFGSFSSFVPVGVIIVFFSITNPPSWYWWIALGLMSSYHILFNKLPVLQLKGDKYSADPEYIKVAESLLEKKLENKRSRENN